MRNILCLEMYLGLVLRKRHLLNTQVGLMFTFLLGFFFALFFLVKDFFFLESLLGLLFSYNQIKSDQLENFVDLVLVDYHNNIVFLWLPFTQYIWRFLNWHVGKLCKGCFSGGQWIFTVVQILLGRAFFIVVFIYPGYIYGGVLMSVKETKHSFCPTISGVVMSRYLHTNM